MRFPSREWFEAAAEALARDPSVTALLADLGPLVAGLVVTGLTREELASPATGGGRQAAALEEELASPATGGGRQAAASEEFCVLARIAPGKTPELRFPEDEDELEELEPDYLFRAPFALCRSLLRGEHPDLLQMVLAGRIKVQGDLQRLVKHGGKHQGAGAGTLRALPTEFV